MRRHSGIAAFCQRIARSGAAFLALATVACATPEASEFRVEAVELDDDAPGPTRVGRLEFRGGLRLHWSDRRFGGLSGLHVSADGRKLTAVSDRGYWFTARLRQDDDGRLIGVEAPAIRPILSPEGEPVTGQMADAESLTRLADGGMIVTFERRHRAWLYPAPEPGQEPDQQVARLWSSLHFARDKLGANKGIEAATQLCDGRVLLLAEEPSADGDTVPLWLLQEEVRPDGEARKTSPAAAMAYAIEKGFVPTGATTAPDCNVLVVERRYRPPIDLSIKVTRIAAADLGPVGATVAPEFLARFSAPQLIDNFEGISARQNEAGETLVYLVSDDNFSALQQTLLFMFALLPPTGQGETRSR